MPDSNLYLRAKSSLERLSKLPPHRRTKLISALGEAAVIALCGVIDSPRWRDIARPEQLAPGTPGSFSTRNDWVYWCLDAGRGFGKTRAGAEWAIEQAREHPGTHGALVAATHDDALKTMLSLNLEHMKEASGILRVSPPDFRPEYLGDKRLLRWPNGSVATLYTAEKPERLRGPQHHWAWVDEIAAWAKKQEAWNQLLLGLRLGAQPRACITTTPRPIPLLKKILADKVTVVSTGSTYANRANLSDSWFESIISQYEGTRVGRQELYAEMLDDHPGALWSLAMIDASRVKAAPEELRRIVVAIDPAVSTNENSCETGIIAAGIAPCSCRGGRPEMHGFVLRDASGKHTPLAWAREAIGLYKRLDADHVIGEVNNGGNLVEVNVRTVDKTVAYRAVRASRGKQTRAEPVASLYEQGKVHHVGALPKLEDQLTTWDPDTGDSPDRLDANVWALTDLLLGNVVNLTEKIELPNLSCTSPWSM